MDNDQKNILEKPTYKSPCSWLLGKYTTCDSNDCHSKLYDVVTGIRGASLSFFYQLIKPGFFLLDPECIHNAMINVGEFLGEHEPTRALTRMLLNYEDISVLSQNICGMKMKNPVGLAAGFDKNARLSNILPDVGFGHAELGSITGRPCAGNPKPRVWRLKKSKSLLIWFGLCNDGSEKICERLDKENKKYPFRIPIGLSVAKANSPECVSLEKGIEDYKKAFDEANNSPASFITINVSCPNAYGGQPFGDATRAKQLFNALLSKSTFPLTKPVFIKLSPDLSEKELTSFLKVASKFSKIRGFICANLTKDTKMAVENGVLHDNLPSKNGGMSGKVVEPFANNMLRTVCKWTQKHEPGRFTLIGCGGVFNADDAYQKIRSGANLVQMVTGMIYEGPQAIGAINRGLSRRLKRDGFKNIQDAVGVDIQDDES